MPAAVVVFAAAAVSGIAATIGGAVVTGLALGTVSAAVATAVGTGIIAGGITAIQGGSTSDVLKSAILSGVGSYVGGQVASRVSSSVSAATGGTSLGTGLTAGAGGATGITAGAAGAGLTTGAVAGSTFITPTVLGITAGAVAGRAVQAAITGQDIGDAALFGLASSVPVLLNESADFRKLDQTTKNVITASAQSAITGQDVPEAAVSALVQSSNIVAKAINEIPGGDSFIRDNPTYARYVIDSVSSALTAELLNKNVNDAVINSLARTTGQLINNEFKNSQRAELVSKSKAQYEDLSQKERELLMIEGQLRDNDRDSRWSNELDTYREAASMADGYGFYYNLYRDEAISSQRSYNQAAQDYGFAGEAFVDQMKLYYASVYENAIIRANEYAEMYQKYLPRREETYDTLYKTGYFREFHRLENDYNVTKSEYDKLLTSITSVANQLTKDNVDLFNTTSRDLLAEIDRFASMEEPEIDADASQYALDAGTRVDASQNSALQQAIDRGERILSQEAYTDPESGVTASYYKVQGYSRGDINSLDPNEIYDPSLFYEYSIRDDPEFGIDYIWSFQLPSDPNNPNRMGDIVINSSKSPPIFDENAKGLVKTGESVSTGELDAGGQGVSVEDIAGIPSFTGTPESDLDALRFNIGVDLREKASPQTGGEGGGATSDSATGDSDSTAVIKTPASPEPPMPEVPEAVGTLTPVEAEAQLQAAIADELEKLEKELADAQFAQQETERTLQRAQEQAQKLTQTRDVGRVSPETETALDAEIRALENQLAESAREAEIAAADKDRIGALQQGAGDLSDEDILSFLETGELPGGAGRPDAGFGTDGEGLPSGAIDGTGIDGIGAEGDGTGLGGEGEGEGFEMDEDVFEPAAEETELPQAIVSLGPEFGERPGTTPFGSRVTGQALESILGEKQPLFGGDDDEQRAVWNRRSLRLLSRALGL